MVNKYISVLLIAILSINLLCSCGAKTDTSAADTYLSMAEDFVAQGNYSSAIDILQKGFSETKDERIALMIAEITSKDTDSNDQSAPTLPNNTESTSTTEATTTTNFDSYAGTWAEENIGWQNGGMIADIQLSENTFTIKLSYTQSAPSSRIAEIEFKTALSEIKNNVLVYAFEDDGWGNKGTVEFSFSQADAIQCKLSGIIPNTSAMWGFYEDNFTLYRNSNAHSSMSYTMEDYYAIHPEERPTEEQPTEDTTTMTIEEMKNNCLIFEWDWSADFAHNSTLSPCTRSDLLENPDSYINQLFVPCQTLTEFIVCPDCFGSGFRHGMADKGKCYNKGYHSIDKTENGIHYILQEYPDQVMLKSISISAISTDVNGALIYEHQYNEDVLGDDYIYDLREDKTIAITENTLFIPYMMFLGKVDGSLRFGMFACDIIG